MINCPKCNLLQPKDQYCANCGINIETWKPPQKPFLKKLFANWIFQLCILLIIVIFLVLRDSLSTPSTEITTPEVSFQDSFKEDQSPQESSFAQQSEREQPKKVKQKTQSLSQQSALSAKVPEKNNALKKDTNLLKNSVSAKVFLAPKQQIEALLSQGQKLDDHVGHVSKKAFNTFTQTNRKDWKRADSIQKSFNPNKPKLLFSGESSTDAEQNIGLYFELTVFDNNDSQMASFELKAWNELKTIGGPEDSLSIELTLPKGDLAIIGGIVSKDRSFSEEERAIFEANSSLRILNSENFIDDFSDIILVLELN